MRHRALTHRVAKMSEDKGSNHARCGTQAATVLCPCQFRPDHCVSVLGTRGADPSGAGTFADLFVEPGRQRASTPWARTHAAGDPGRSAGVLLPRWHWMGGDGPAH